ncbi:hypothetical protein Mapa_005771 [Marchantia paleacea]|nr:hypothetical protein Mapa_005771 [Marchantia paleacea]
MGNPFSAMLRARFWPMTAKPARPILDTAASAISALELGASLCYRPKGSSERPTDFPRTQSRRKKNQAKSKTHNSSTLPFLPPFLHFKHLKRPLTLKLSSGLLLSPSLYRPARPTCQNSLASRDSLPCLPPIPRAPVRSLFLQSLDLLRAAKIFLSVSRLCPLAELSSARAFRLVASSPFLSCARFNFQLRGT